MNQPPQKLSASEPPPQWRRPRGVAPGTWQYVHQRSIADRYDDFVADTPLCSLDQRIISETFPAAPQLSASSAASDRPSIVDLGCGTGRTAIPLAERGYDIVGVDLSKSMLEQLRLKAAALEQPVLGGESPITGGAGRELGYAVGRVQPLCANLAQLDCLADQAIDHAVCLFSTLGMIAGQANRQSVLCHAARIVRPGGRLVLHVHHRWAALHEPGGLAKLARSWWKARMNAESDFGDSVYAYRGLPEMFMHRFSRREVIGLLKTSGWQIDQLHLVSVDGATTVKSLRRTGGFIVVATKPKSTEAIQSR